MLVIRIEVHPNGDKSRATLLHELRVTNDCTGTEKRGNYDVECDDHRNNSVTTRHARVENHLRVPGSGAFALAIKALNEIAMMSIRAVCFRRTSIDE